MTNPKEHSKRLTT